MNQISSLRRIEFLYQYLKSPIAAQAVKGGIDLDYEQPKLSSLRGLIERASIAFSFLNWFRQIGSVSSEDSPTTI